MFCVSGLILNHPSLFSKIDISRRWLPSAYRYNNWNNGLLRGTEKWRAQVLLYGNMVLWGRLAETLASYATKGSLISVDGELRTRRFEKNGQTNYVTEVLVTGFQLLESRAQRALRENNAGQDLADLVLEEEELPF